MVQTIMDPIHSSERPHIIVGIDVGHTHTGVAYTRFHGAGELQEPSVIQQWPGKPIDKINKVPTKLTYRGLGTSGPSGWGFNLRKDPTRNGQETVVKELFKLSLDETLMRKAHDQEQKVLSEDQRENYDYSVHASIHEDAKREYKDYLKCLYNFIKFRFREDEGYIWDQCKIEFIFSVPTTWNIDVVDMCKSIIGEAGYGRVQGHDIRMGLTEADAAAVYTAMYDSTEAKSIVGDGDERIARRYKEGDVLLVCDAGGGTTDVSALQVKSFNHGYDGIPQMDELGPMNGDIIGSVDIDNKFEILVMERLQRITANHRGEKFERADAAKEMAKGDSFQVFKEHFGQTNTNLPTFNFNVPGMNHEDNWPAPACISDGQMKFTKGELKQLFDDVVKRIFAVIDDTLSNIERGDPSLTVKYLVLSGGLGSSAYLHQCLKDRYIHQPTFTNTKNLELMVAKDPQLVVCRGLVLDGIKNSYDISVIKGRCSRSWFGVTYNELWDASKHGKDVERVKNPNDKKWYVPDSICWILKRAAFVKENEPPKNTFSQTLSYRGNDKWVDHRIVRCDLRDSPPDVFGEATEDIHTVCKIRCNLADAIEAQGEDLQQVEVRKRKVLNGPEWGKRFIVVKYDIVLKIVGTNLKPELWFGGENRSDERYIKVEWNTKTRVMAQEANFDQDYDPSIASNADSGYGGAPNNVGHFPR